MSKVQPAGVPRVAADTGDYRTLRYAGVCRRCGTSLARGTWAYWERGYGVQCCACRPHLARPGDSALRIGERRNATSWLIGGDGERRLGEYLERCSCETVRVLHDLAMPLGRGNIDHLVITSRGVHVIDAKLYEGQLVRRTRGVSRFRVGKRNGTKHVNGALRQRDAVRVEVPASVPVFAVLCYIDARWLWYDQSFSVSGVRVCAPAKLRRLVRKRGPLTAAEVQDVYNHVLARFRAA